MRETRILEFKETITNTFLKTVSAFSNYDGGEILFGVDDGNIKGLSNVKQACLDIENKINDNISPQPNYTHEIQNSDQTIKLNVKSGLQKPYLYKSKAYKRNDTSTIEVDTLEFSRLVLEGKNIRFEELPCIDQELSFEILQSNLKEKIQIETFNKDTLKILNLYDNNNGYREAWFVFSEYLAYYNELLFKEYLESLGYKSDVSIAINSNLITTREQIKLFKLMDDLYRGKDIGLKELRIVDTNMQLDNIPLFDYHHLIAFLASITKYEETKNLSLLDKTKELNELLKTSINSKVMKENYLDINDSETVKQLIMNFNK